MVQTAGYDNSRCSRLARLSKKKNKKNFVSLSCRMTKNPPASQIIDKVLMFIGGGRGRNQMVSDADTWLLYITPLISWPPGSVLIFLSSEVETSQSHRGPSPLVLQGFLCVGPRGCEHNFNCSSLHLSPTWQSAEGGKVKRKEEMEEKRGWGEGESEREPGKKTTKKKN